MATELTITLTPDPLLPNVVGAWLTIKSEFEVAGQVRRIQTSPVQEFQFHQVDGKVIAMVGTTPVNILDRWDQVPGWIHERLGDVEILKVPTAKATA